MKSKITAYVDSRLKEALDASLTRGELSKVVERALEDSAFGADFEDMLEDFGEKLDELPSSSYIRNNRPSVKGSSTEIIAKMRRASS